MQRLIPALLTAAALLVSGVMMPPIALAKKPAPQCVQTTIARVTSYFENDPSSGSVIIFASNLGVSHFKDQKATIVDRYATAGAAITKARAGDSVKLCLVDTPKAGEGCDPNKDPRGRIYSAYDNRLRASFTGSNANHGCGGA